MEITEQQAKKTLKKAKSKTEWAELLGFHYLNGRISKKLSTLIELYNLDISHFDTHHKKRKYSLIKKKCPICGNSFETQKNHPREKTVCSHSCSNTYFANRRHTKEANNKASNSIKAYIKSSGKFLREVKACIKCRKEFLPWRQSQLYCGRSCGAKDKLVTAETRKKLRTAQIKLIAEGKHTGWQSRSKCKQSYAEEYVTKILNKNGLTEGKNYEFEYRQNKWFIDFAFVEDKIAIEIDGKQHNYPDRKIKDAEKDTWLTKNGWTVYRIKWRKPSKETRKHLLTRLNNILSYKIVDDTI
jgi:very-short-patch-repair endonuclease